MTGKDRTKVTSKEKKGNREGIQWRRSSLQQTKEEEEEVLRIIRRMEDMEVERENGRKARRNK